MEITSEQVRNAYNAMQSTATNCKHLQCFSLDAHNNENAIEFLQTNGFVCFEPLASIVVDCQQLATSNQTAPKGHAAFAFLHNNNSKTPSSPPPPICSKLQLEVRQVLDDEIDRKSVV
jgi:hypothetical protein